MQGGTRDVVLYAITIDPHQKISMELSKRGWQEKKLSTHPAELPQPYPGARILTES